jgi:hypothetical protein
VAALRIVLAFVAPPAAAVAAYGAPQQMLVWYGRTPTLAPGATAALSFKLTARELSFAGPDGLPMLFEGDWQLCVDGLNATLTVGEVARDAGSAPGARQPRYRQRDWAAVSGLHASSEGSGLQRTVQRSEGFASTQPQMPGVR